MRLGDLIIKINNNVPDKYRSVQIWSEAEGSSTIEIRRVDQPNDQIINIPKHPVLQSELSQIPMVIQGLIFFIFGFMAWFRRPFLLQARALFWLNWFIGLAIVLAPASSRDLFLARELEYVIFSAVPMAPYIQSAIIGEEIRTKKTIRPYGTSLTAKEIEIIELIAQGFRNREIITALNIKNRTVDFHVNNIMTKLGVKSRLEAVLTYMKDNEDRSVEM